MSAAIPLRRDFDASQLRGFARKTKDGPQARRLLALAAIYDGGTRTEAAKIGGAGLQIIRDWVLRFNARRARCPCHPLGRSSWLALVDPPRRAGKHHHHCAAAKMPRAQSGRKCLAVHARQLALEPSLQILRRSRRPLLQRLEQAGRSALAHHVHWTAPMGARVLIKGNWY